MAEIVNLIHNEPDNVPLGESVISFTLSFHDIFENSTTIFKGENDHVVLSCSTRHLEVKGLKEKYRPNKDGILKGIIISLNI